MLYNLFENRDFVSVFAVALLAEGVDRNNMLDESIRGAIVALLAEGVDRNLVGTNLLKKRHLVALLAEGVDRNCTVAGLRLLKILSPSSRRAWIEIQAVQPQFFRALMSPSSRRAWIEISVPQASQMYTPVALLAEGVDRNWNWHHLKKIKKHVALLAEGVDRNFFHRSSSLSTGRSPSSRRAWIEIA